MSFFFVFITIALPSFGLLCGYRVARRISRPSPLLQPVSTAWFTRDHSPPALLEIRSHVIPDNDPLNPSIDLFTVCLDHSDSVPKAVVLPAARIYRPGAPVVGDCIFHILPPTATSPGSVHPAMPPPTPTPPISEEFRAFQESPTDDSPVGESSAVGRTATGLRRSGRNVKGSRVSGRKGKESLRGGRLVKESSIPVASTSLPTRKSPPPITISTARLDEILNYKVDPQDELIPWTYSSDSSATIAAKLRYTAEKAAAFAVPAPKRAPVSLAEVLKYDVDPRRDKLVPWTYSTDSDN